MLVKQKLIAIPADLWEQIEALQRAENLSAQQAILVLIAEALERRQKGKKR